MARQNDILDAASYRARLGGPSFSLRNRLARATWSLTWLLLASWTPRQLQPWRRFLLNAFGARLEDKADVRAGARVWYPPHLIMGAGAVVASGVNCYNMARVTLGRDTLVSQGAHLCAGTHDHESPDFQLVARPIEIGPQAWIAAEAFVGPGVRVGEGAVLGARAVAFRDLDAWTVYSGNPAKPLRPRRIRDDR